MNDKVLYVGTDVGVYTTVDGGETWHVLANGLPSTFVQDLVVHPRDHIMVIATHGRGMYAMDVRTINGVEKAEPEVGAETGTEEGGQRRRRRRPNGR